MTFCLKPPLDTPDKDFWMCVEAKKSTQIIIEIMVMNCLSKCNQGLRTLSVILALNRFYIFLSATFF